MADYLLRCHYLNGLYHMYAVLMLHVQLFEAFKEVMKIKGETENRLETIRIRVGSGTWKRYFSSVSGLMKFVILTRYV